MPHCEGTSGPPGTVEPENREGRLSGLTQLAEETVGMTSADLEPFRDLVAGDHGLAVISIAAPSGVVHASVANAGVIELPGRDAPVVGVVIAGMSRKLKLLRDHPRAAATLRAGWLWSSVEGPVELVGPNDPHPDFDADQTRLLLREIFAAAGGHHDDWDTYDRVMAEEGRTAVLITPESVYKTPG
jgi:hypothetical protein